MASSSPFLSTVWHPVPYRQIRAYQPTASFSKEGFFCSSASTKGERQAQQKQEELVVVYQAYKSSIATAAVAAQKLDASPDFRHGRMTWIKPSWAWMLYRSGYARKDSGQEHILALTMRKKDLIWLLEKGVLSNSCGAHHHSPTNGANSNRVKGQSGSCEIEQPEKLEKRKKCENVRIQWDPERDYRLQKKVPPQRSIQIGIPGTLTQRWIEGMIISIEDVTHRAHKLESLLQLEETSRQKNRQKGNEMAKEKEEETDNNARQMGLLPDETVLSVPAHVGKRLGMDGFGKDGVDRDYDSGNET